MWSVPFELNLDILRYTDTFELVLSSMDTVWFSVLLDR